MVKSGAENITTSNVNCTWLITCSWDKLCCDPACAPCSWPTWSVAISAFIICMICTCREIVITGYQMLKFWSLNYFATIRYILGEAFGMSLRKVLTAFDTLWLSIMWITSLALIVRRLLQVFASRLTTFCDGILLTIVSISLPEILPSEFTYFQTLAW